MKKATEFGEAEVWMNERMMRYAPDAVARFITAFSDGDKVQGLVVFPRAGQDVMARPVYA